MPTLVNYNHFAGRHNETGTIHNYYTALNVTAPHMNQPYSEALLLGVSGGITFGYFTFAYEGYDPHVSLLTRNTFAPWDTMLSRLGVVQEIRQTTKPEKAVVNLLDTLEDGAPAIVWADIWTMPYNAMPFDKGMWGMSPLIVYGYDADADLVHIADRSGVPLMVTTEVLAAARARVKKDKFRIATLDHPDPEKLAAAVSAGIWDTIKLFTEKPPKGSKKNFGFAAYNHWIELLTKPKARQSWAKEFPAGVKFYAGLTTAFDHMGATGVHSSYNECDGDRGLYADFLEEAAIILEKPGLKETAQTCRESATAWASLGTALLPDAVPLLRESRELTIQNREIFLTQGNSGLPTIEQINERLRAIRQEMVDDFPLSDSEVLDLQGGIAAAVEQIHDIEIGLIQQMTEIMS